jgi:hypothetical protein
MATLVGNIQGPAGPQGAPGSPGADGAAGPAGPAGADGAPGATGPAGPEGPAGTGVDIKGSVADEAGLPADGNSEGDAYITEDNGHLWVWDGSGWIDAGEIRGPAGPEGPAGADGAEGPAGPAGAAGADGAPGSRGTGWFTGAGAPVEPVAGSIAGDLYLDSSTGDVYTLAGA